MTVLKPCPFCGKDPVIECMDSDFEPITEEYLRYNLFEPTTPKEVIDAFIADSIDELTYYVCIHCPCGVQFVAHNGATRDDLVKEAMSGWNRRAKVVE